MQCSVMALAVKVGLVILGGVPHVVLRLGHEGRISHELKARDGGHDHEAQCVAGVEKRRALLTILDNPVKFSLNIGFFL